LVAARDLRPDSPEFGKSLAIFLIHLKKHQDALDVLAAVVEDHPQFVDAHHLIGRVAFAMGRNSQALKAKGAAVDLDPRNVDLRISLAEAERHIGIKPVAVDHLNRILAIDPLYQVAMSFKAQCIVEINGAGQT
jgi:predicted Zn-dependent protease